MIPSYVTGTIKRVKMCKDVDWSDFESVKRYAHELTEDAQHISVLCIGLGRGKYIYRVCSTEFEQDHLERYDDVRAVYRT